MNVTKHERPGLSRQRGPGFKPCHLSTFFYENLPSKHLSVVLHSEKGIQRRHYLWAITITFGPGPRARAKVCSTNQIVASTVSITYEPGSHSVSSSFFASNSLHLNKHHCFYIIWLYLLEYRWWIPRILYQAGSWTRSGRWFPCHRECWHQGTRRNSCRARKLVLSRESGEKQLQLLNLKSKNVEHEHIWVWEAQNSLSQNI